MPTQIKPKPAWFLGLDLGQRRDHSALAAVELTWKDEGLDRATYQHIFQPGLVLRTLSRFPLGTSYLQIANIIHNEITRIDAQPRPLAVSNPPAKHLTVDAGGPGGPVVELIRTAKLPAVLKPILITSGDAPGHVQGGFSTIPRKVLISNLLLILDQGALKAPTGLSNWPILVEELLQLHSAANNQPEKASNHDDIVIALTLAVWEATRSQPQLLKQPPRARAPQTGRLL